MGQASPSGVGEHLSEGDTGLQPADPSKKLPTLSETREGMRRLQMGYVWELRNLIESGRFDIDSYVRGLIGFCT